MGNFLLCILNVILLVCGQLLFKYGMRNIIIGNISDMLHAIVNPIILIAICIYGATTILWLYILNKVALSFAYPIQSLAMPLVCIAAVGIFGESLTLAKVVGIIIITVGVIISSR